MKNSQSTPTPTIIETRYLEHLKGLAPEVRAELRLYDRVEVLTASVPGLEGMGEAMRDILTGDVCEALANEPELAGAVQALRDAGHC